MDLSAPLISHFLSKRGWSAMTDQSSEMSEREESLLQVVVVTARRDLCNKLRESSRVLSARGLSLELALDLPQAFAAGPRSGAVVLVFDSIVEPHAMTELPRAWAINQPNGQLILLTEHRDPMFERSALAVGYDDCICFEEAMRADFLFRILENQGGSRPKEIVEPDFDSIFADTPGAVLVSHVAGRVVYANDAFFAAAGLQRSNLRGVNFSTFFPEISPTMLRHCPPGERRLLEFRRGSGNSYAVEAHFLAPQSDLGPYVAIRF